MANYYQCPGCGALIPDRESAEVIQCERCGSTITKYIPNKTIRVKDVGSGIENVTKEKEITKRLELEAKEREQIRDNKESNRAILGLFALVILIVVVMLIMKN